MPIYLECIYIFLYPPRKSTRDIRLKVLYCPLIPWDFKSDTNVSTSWSIIFSNSFVSHQRCRLCWIIFLVDTFHPLHPNSITTLHHLHSRIKITTLQQACAIATDTILPHSVGFTLKMSDPMSGSGLCSERHRTPFAPFAYFAPCSSSGNSLIV